MTRPTDDELEAMAVRLDQSDANEYSYDNDKDQAAAMLRACKGRVRVKPLEWRDSYGVFRAETPFGDYKIAGHVLHRLGNPAPQSVHDTLAAAKAAAQADYERRARAFLARLEGDKHEHSDWNVAIEAAANTAAGEVAAMLRACKGQTRNIIYEEPIRGGRGSYSDAALEYARSRYKKESQPAPDHSDWNAAIEAAAKSCADEARHRTKQIEDKSVTDRDQLLRWGAGKVQAEVLAKKIRTLKKGPHDE